MAAAVLKQVIKMRKTFGSNVRFMLMNSFSTSEDTLEFLQKYPELANDPNLELVQVRKKRCRYLGGIFFGGGWGTRIYLRIHRFFLCV